MGKDIEMLNILMDKMSDEEETIAMDNRFPYLFTKAYIYLKSGPDNYRKDDYFKLPSKSLDIDELEAIETQQDKATNKEKIKRLRKEDLELVAPFNVLLEDILNTIKTSFKVYK